MIFWIILGIVISIIFTVIFENGGSFIFFPFIILIGFFSTYKAEETKVLFQYEEKLGYERTKFLEKEKIVIYQDFENNYQSKKFDDIKIKVENPSGEFYLNYIYKNEYNNPSFFKFKYNKNIEELKLILK